MDFMDWRAGICMKIALGGLAISGLCFLAAWLAPYIRAAWDKAGRFARSVFCAAVAIAVLFGGAKTASSSRFTFASGLVDNGSYSTNDTVYVAWKTTTGLPSSTTVYIESRAKSDTNGVYSAIGNTTYGSGSWTGTLANATNYNFNIWHNYEPPAPVHTNGTWVYTTIKAKHQPDDNALNAVAVKAKVIGTEDGDTVSVSPTKVSLLNEIAEEASTSVEEE